MHFVLKFFMPVPLLHLAELYFEGNIMAINFNNGIGSGQNSLNGTKGKDNVTPIHRDGMNTSNGQGAKDDSVNLSSQVQSLQSLEAEIKKMPDADLGRVDQIKSAIANGEYTINYERLAAAIQKFEGSL